MSEAQRGRSVPREYFESLLIAFIFVNFARIFVFQAFKIPSGSMHDNLLVGDHIIVNKFIYGPPVEGGAVGLPRREIQRGDVVVFRFPKGPTSDYVKRVIALPGEVVTIRDKKVFVNGAQIPEPYTTFEDPRVYPLEPALPEPWRSRDQFGPYRIPDAHFFVLGDNRDRSNDSRYWGTVPRELIKGRALLVYWSFRLPPAPSGSPAGERVKELVSVILHFFSETRWDRTFMVIDSKYHYHERSNRAE
jgi:signal peptidase I